MQSMLVMREENPLAKMALILLPEEVILGINIIFLQGLVDLEIFFVTLATGKYLTVSWLLSPDVFSVLVYSFFFLGLSSIWNGAFFFLIIFFYAESASKDTPIFLPRGFMFLPNQLTFILLLITDIDHWKMIVFSKKKW